MRRFSRGTYLACTVSASLLLVIAAKKMHTTVFVMKRCTVTVDSLLSQQIVQEISAFCENNNEITVMRTAEIFYVLQEKFHYIKSITAQYSPSAFFDVGLTASNPMLAINQQ